MAESQKQSSHLTLCLLMKRCRVTIQNLKCLNKMYTRERSVLKAVDQKPRYVNLQQPESIILKSILITWDMKSQRQVQYIETHLANE